jgi:hypothetical protein
MTSQQRTEREACLTHSVQKSLPGFADACNAEVDEVILDQGAFAVEYQDDEYRLLGMAIKYAGLRHKHVRVIASA